MSRQVRSLLLSRNHHRHHYVTSIQSVAATLAGQEIAPIGAIDCLRRARRYLSAGARSLAPHQSRRLLKLEHTRAINNKLITTDPDQRPGLVRGNICYKSLAAISYNCAKSLLSSRRPSVKQSLKTPPSKTTSNSAWGPIMKQSSKSLPPIADQLLLMPAHKLSKLIKDGTLSSTKLCELYIERIKLVHSYTNTMAQDCFKEALDEAKRVDTLLADFRSGKAESEFSPDELELLHSPLMGVPVSVKESIQVKGLRNSCGLWYRRNAMADDDAVVVKNARRFGLIPVCTTNIPECTLYWADCQNKIYGRTRNPYDTSRITGSSSGGEGGLIGGGGSVLGIGSDIAGSLRIPAHYCGIFSHKPSPFLVSPEGNFPQVKESRLRLFTLGPMTRYASDLRPLLKCLLSDKNNPKQDTYHRCQPDNIQSIRKDVIHKLDNPNTDLSQLKFYYFNFNEASELKGKQSVHVQEDIMEAQREIIDHFNSKFSCQVEQINLDKYLKKILITWQCMLCCGGVPDRDTSFDPYELNEIFGVNSWLLEVVKLTLGLSKHTKESLIALVLGSAVPKDRAKAYELCDKFEKFAAEIRADMESSLGDNGILIMPTLPTVAYKNNVALMKTNDLRFTALFNVLLLPVSHATIRLDKKHKLPYGFSIAARQYNDHLTISVAEEIELAFGGWTPPSGVADSIQATLKETNVSGISAGGDVRQDQAV